MYIVDRLCEQTDHHCDYDADAEEDAAEVQVVDVFDDAGPRVFRLLPAGRHAVRILPGEPHQPRR